MSIAKTILGVLTLSYLVVATLTHPLLPSSTDFLAQDRAIRLMIGLREALLVALFGMAAFVTLGRRMVPLYAFILYAAVLMTRDALVGDVPVVIAIRALIMVTLPILLMRTMERAPELLGAVSAGLKIAISLAAGIALFQLFAIPGYYGTTFLGPRVFGAMASPLHLSYTAGIAAIFFATRRPGSGSGAGSVFWVLVCFGLCLLSGGRAGILISLVALMALLANQFEATKHIRAIGALVAGVLLVAAAFVVSNPVISGRAGTSGGPLEDGRFNVWASALGTWQNGSIWEILFGSGVGEGSNAMAAYVSDFYFTDSAFVFLLLSFGICGLVYMTGLTLWTMMRLSSGPVIVAWFIAAATQLYYELQPFTVILALCLHARYDRRALRADSPHASARRSVGATDPAALEGHS